MSETYKYKILLADDDADDRDFFKYALEQLQVNMDLLTEAKSGQEVLDILESKQEDFPDIIVLDQNMPLLTGEQTLTLLKANDRLKHIPVAIYSTSSFREGQGRFADLGAICVAVKPVRLDDYRGMVEHILKIIPTSA